MQEMIHAVSDTEEAARQLAIPIEHSMYFHIVKPQQEGRLSLDVRRLALSKLHEAIHNWLDDDETDPATE